jgi:hypothetical protein
LMGHDEATGGGMSWIPACPWCLGPSVRLSRALPPLSMTATGGKCPGNHSWHLSRHYIRNGCWLLSCCSGSFFIDCCQEHLCPVSHSCSEDVAPVLNGSSRALVTGTSQGWSWGNADLLLCTKRLITIVTLLTALSFVMSDRDIFEVWGLNGQSLVKVASFVWKRALFD